MNPESLELQQYFRMLLPLIVIAVPAMSWVSYRKAASVLGPDSPQLPSIRTAALFLAVLMLFAGALVTAASFLSGLPFHTCLMELPPISAWGYAIWGGQLIFSAALLVWLWAGPGATQLAAFVAAPPKGWRFTPSRLRLAVTVGLVAFPAIIAIVEWTRDVRPYCVTGLT